MAAITGYIQQIPRKILMAAITLYQFAFAPLLGQHCRFFPSCSHYMQEAVQKHGLLRGFILGCKRLLRCHPLCKGGIDTVPERKNNHD